MTNVNVCKLVFSLLPITCVLTRFTIVAERSSSKNHRNNHVKMCEEYSSQLMAHDFTNKHTNYVIMYFYYLVLVDHLYLSLCIIKIYYYRVLLVDKV